MTGAFHDLLHTADPTLSDDDLAALVLDPARWESALDAASFDDVSTPSDERPAQNDDAAPLVDRIEEQGWARVDRGLSPARVGCVLDAIAEVGRHGLPPVFAYLYPEVWSALAAPGLRGPLQALLPGARQLPRSWITVVRPVDGARGWEPHLDANRPAKRMRDGRCERLTLWIALTDATVDNGCIHLVPASRASAPFTDLFEEERVSSARALALMHAIQAAPCAAGGALLWRTDVIHFGGWASGEGLTRRVGVALHFLHGDARVPARERPVRDFFASVPDHAERAAFVGRQVLAYQAYARELPSLPRFADLARRMLEGA